MPSSSIREVAAAAGVSKSTASLALRHHPSVAEETRKRVEVAARKLGYRANPLIAALMTLQREGRAAEGATTIGLVDLVGASADPVHASSFDIGGSVPYLKEGQAAARAAARAFGYRLDVVTARTPGMTPERLEGILRARGIRGILLVMPPVPETPAIWMREWSDFSVVHLGTPASPFHHVRPNIIGSVEVMMSELRARGYLRPGLAVYQANRNYAGQRWEMALRHHLAGTSGVELLLNAPNSWQLRELSRWAKQAQPDVICAVGAGDLENVREAGLRVPEGVGFVAVNLLVSDFGKVAGLDLRHAERYLAAVQLLDSLLRRNETGVPAVPLAVTISGAWVDGPTVRPRQL